MDGNELCSRDDVMGWIEDEGETGNVIVNFTYQLD